MSAVKIAESCPFCGKEPTVISDSDNIPGAVECETEDCLLYGPAYPLDQWNARLKSVESDVFQAGFRRGIIESGGFAAALPCSACGKEHQAWMDQEGECLACEIATLKAERDRLKEAIKNAIAGLDCLERGRYADGGPIQESMRPSFASHISTFLRLALEGDRQAVAPMKLDGVRLAEEMGYAVDGVLKTAQSERWCSMYFIRLAAAWPQVKAALAGTPTETAKQRKERVETEEACRLLNERDGFQPRRDPA